MTFYYFAFGSNMLTTRLKARCAGAIPVGRAVADGTVIEFSKPSIDRSGKATLRREAGGRTVGVLFEIPIAELGQLDCHEGVANGYERRDAFPVRLVDDDEMVRAAAYLATSPNNSLKPYDWYLALVIAGAYEHGLGDDYLSELRRVAYMLDPNDSRRTRAEAIEALTAAGFAIYRKLLSEV